MKYIFLDIDGVLNGHEKHPNGYSGMRPDCVARLNQIIAETDAKLVITSAWRYTVLMGFSTIKGLENLLLTHGVDCHNRIVGITEPDHHAGNRGELISRWISQNCYESFSYVVLDNGGEDENDDLGIRKLHGYEFVRTNGKIGLVDDEMEYAIVILGHRPYE